MKKKILVIFLLSISTCITIYRFMPNKKENILVIGEEKIEIINNNYNIKYFLYDKITYKELINSIKNNDYITSKNKKIYLNKLIYSSDYIVISANKNTCKENKRANRLKIDYLIKLITEINKISTSKIIIVNYCNVSNKIKDVKLINKSKINVILNEFRT